MDRLAAIGGILDAIGAGFIGLRLAEPDTGRLVYTAANATASAITGLDVEAMIGLPVEEQMPSIREAGLEAVYAEVIRTRVPVWIDQARLHSEPMAGQVFSVAAIPLDIAGAASMVGLIFRNITEQVAAAERTRFQSRLLEVVDAGVVAATLDGRITFWNPHAERLYEVASSEAVGHPAPDLLPADQFQRIFEAVGRGEVTSMETAVRTGSGRTFPIQLTVSPLRDADGEVNGLVGVSTDITDRVRAEEALRGSEQRMRALLEAIPDVVARLSRDGVLLDLSRSFKELPLEPGMNIRAVAENGMTSASIDGLLAALQRTASSTSVETAELEVLTGGETRHFEARLLAAGADEVVAIIRDVTERRHMELALVAANNELEWRVRARTAELREVNEALRTLIDASPLAIISVEIDGRVRSWNRAAERIFGFTAEETIGRFVPIVPPEDLDDSTACAMAVIRNESTDHVTERIRLRKDGTRILTRVRFARLTAASGEVRGLVGLVEDITEARRLQEVAMRREQQMALLRTVTDAIHRAAGIEQLLRALSEPLVAVGIEAGLLSINLESPQGEERFAWGLPAEAVEELRVDESDDRGVVRLSAGAGARFRSWAVVPVSSLQGTRGHVLFLSATEAAFDEDVLRLLRVIGSEIGGAVENIVLFRNMRTAMQVVRKLSQRIATIRESERRHLGLELHDQLGQSLTALKLSLEASGRRGVPAAEDLHAAARLVSDLIADVRSISLSLRESPVNRGLFAGLEAIAARFTADAGIEVDLARSGTDAALPGGVELTVYRVVQESLTNVARHAGVSSARVEVAVTAHAVIVHVNDSGRGFDVTEALSRVTGGLSGMFERLRLAGGSLAIDSAPGHGTRIDALVPLNAPVDGPARERDA